MMRAAVATVESRATGSEQAIARSAMPLAASLLLVALAVGIFVGRHWPLVHDAVLIHYVVFLMAHGRAPYRDIFEMNMPGTYMYEWLSIHLLGGGAPGWRAWDICLGAVAIGASSWIAGTGKRWAGVGAGALAWLSHKADGAEHMGQRDWVVAVLLLLALGCVFEALRKQQPLWMAGFAVCCGFAASIKPPAAVFALVFLAAAGWQLRRTYGASATGYWARFLLWSLAGASIPAVATFTFLAHWGATKDFFEMTRGLLPWYARMQTVSKASLLERAIVFRPLLCGAAIVFVAGRSWRRWESMFLAAAALVGAGLFVLQGKGWMYHLYPVKVFAALWAMLELQRALGAERRERLVAVLTLIVVTGVMAPRLLYYESKNHYPLETISHLQQDLNALGGSRLNDGVQCLDMTEGGCIDVLYRMKLLQSTGFIYDFYLFPTQPNPVAGALQQRFLGEVEARAPEVMVLSSQIWPGYEQGYSQLDNWPKFKDYLLAHYELQREFPIQQRSAGYRIYVLRGAVTQ